MPCGRREDTDTQREGGHRPQTKPRVGPQTLPEDREGPPAEAARGARPRWHLAFGRVAPRTVRKRHFSCVEPPTLWHLAAAVPGEAAHRPVTIDRPGGHGPMVERLARGEAGARTRLEP